MGQRLSASGSRLAAALNAWRRRSWSERLTLLEASVALAIARGAIVAVPWGRVAPLVGRPMAESANHAVPADQPALIAVSRAVRTAARRLPWRCLCLEQALAARLMLGRRRIASTLYLGTALSPTGIEAHAWLRSGATILTGAEGRERYVVVATFADE